MIPKVLTEKDTFRLIRDKKMNLARYGDGEFKLARGKSIRLQSGSKEIQYHMQNILKNPRPNVLPAIQNIYDPKLFNTLPPGKQKFWKTYKSQEILNFIDPDRVYGSSFVGRKDNAPWISCDDILEWKTLWEDEIVISVVGNVKWEIDIIDNTKKKITLNCPPTEAFSEFGSIYKRIKDAWTKANAYIVVLHLGPTATVLANELAKDNIWAIDLGSWQFNYSCECRKQGHIYK